MLTTFGKLRKLIRESLNSETISLFRGMTQSVYDDLIRTGTFSVPTHNGNVASTDVTTALYYAGQRCDEDDPSIVVAFDAPLDAVKQDTVYKDDFVFTRNFKPISLRVVRDNIVEPIREF